MIVDKILDAIETSIGTTGVAIDSNFAKLVYSPEELKGGHRATVEDMAKQLVDGFEASLEAAINPEGMGIGEEYGLSVESMDADRYVPTAAQRKALDVTAKIMSNPEMAINPPSRTVTAGDDGYDVSYEELEISDVSENRFHGLKVSKEAFDGQGLEKTMAFSIAYNFMASRQDAFGEAWFPTVIGQPGTAGFTVTMRNIKLYNEFLRNDLEDVKDKMGLKNLVKAYTDETSFTYDTNRIVPVLRAATEDALLPALQRNTDVTGEKVVTAPLKIGMDIPVLSIVQSAASLAKGTYDDTDTLDRNVQVEKVYLNFVEGDNDETMGFDVADEAGSRWMPTRQGDKKDIQLDLEARIVLTKETKQWDDSTSTILAAIPDGYKVFLKAEYFGKGSVSYGNVRVNSIAITVDKIVTGNGIELAKTDATYATVTAALGTITAVGYDLEMYTTNSNNRSFGQLMTVDHTTQVYTVPVRSGISIKKTHQSNKSDKENDTEWLETQIVAAGIKTSKAAVKTLVNYASRMQRLTDSGVDLKDVAIAGVAREVVNPTFINGAIDVEAIVDSQRSSERIVDIKSAFEAYLSDTVVQMYRSSNYDVAYKIRNNNVEKDVTVLIGTNDRVARYLKQGGDLDLGEGFKTKIVTTPNPAIGDKIYLSFIIDDSTKNTVAEPLSFGNMVWYPEVVVDAVRETTGGGGTLINVTTTNPRFMHFIHLPILAVFDITNISSALSKVSRHFKSIA